MLVTEVVVVVVVGVRNGIKEVQAVDCRLDSFLILSFTSIYILVVLELVKSSSTARQPYTGTYRRSGFNMQV